MDGRRDKVQATPGADALFGRRALLGWLVRRCRATPGSSIG